MKKVISLLLTAALAASALAGCSSEVKGTDSAAPSQEAPAESGASQAANLSGKLTLNGSTSMAKVCQALGEAFQAKYPGVTVEKSGTGSGDAAKAVDAGTALIGDLSRDLKPEEKPENYEVKQIAIDGIAIAVHKDNPVSALTSDQITKIFTGEITNWKDVGGSDEKITVLGLTAARSKACFASLVPVPATPSNAKALSRAQVRGVRRGVDLTRPPSAMFRSIP